MLQQNLQKLQDQQQKCGSDKAKKDKCHVNPLILFSTALAKSKMDPNQQQKGPLANHEDFYKTVYKWEIDKVMALEQSNGEYVQSKTFSTKGPYGQDVKFALRLFPRGKRGTSKNNVSIFLHLLDGNGSNYVKVDWKLTVIHENGTKINEQEQKACLFDMDTRENGFGFNNYMTRTILDKKYTIGNKLTLQFEITIKVEKDLQAELIEKREETKSLKRKLDSKEEEFEMLYKKFERFKKRSQSFTQKIQADQLAATKKCKKEEEARWVAL